VKPGRAGQDASVVAAIEVGAASDTGRAGDHECAGQPEIRGPVADASSEI
jgi:hypothetical protein